MACSLKPEGNIDLTDLRKVPKMGLRYVLREFALYSVSTDLTGPLPPRELSLSLRSVAQPAVAFFMPSKIGGRASSSSADRGKR